MLVVISPAKKLNTNLSISAVPTKPMFSKNAIELLQLLRVNIIRIKKFNGFK